ncbi:MAG: HAD-IB family phosphatase [Planctomycetes bacterium]|nr:HAD-IB family phosphatase [Planctomycetota bacterium]
MTRDQAPPYEAVVFDCDSTLSCIEGIDELAGGHAEAVSELTRRAMDGEVPLDEVYGRRLEMIRPDRDAVDRVAARYVETLVPGIKEVFEALRAAGKRISIVSGGLLPAVSAVGEALGVDPSEVFAVDLYFDEDGAYAGFEEGSPLARAGGKLDVLEAIAARTREGRIVLVGDGVTDLEALPVISRFIAWGGVVHRDEVHQRSCCSTDGPDARELLPFLLSDAELAGSSWSAPNA